MYIDFVKRRSKMKISQKEKEKTRQRIILQAAQLIGKNGYNPTSMREIARAAEISDATIYNYFKTKDMILYAYFEDLVERLVDTLKNIDDFEQFSFAEQIQTTIQSQIELMEPDRAFIKETYEQVFLHNWVAANAGGRVARQNFLSLIEDMINAAIDAEEFAEPPFKGLVIHSLWDLSVGITFYWLKDSSENSQNTIALLDKVVALLVATLESRILAKATDLIQFMIREHIFSRLNGPGGLGNWNKRIQAKRSSIFGKENPNVKTKS